MKTIFHALRGSYAHGLATAESDEDHFRIVIPPVEAIIGLSEMKGSQRIEGNNDIRIITLREFLRAVEHGRSTELEMLWATEDVILECTAEGRTLLDNKECLLSQRLFKPLFGFAGGQIKRSLKGNTDRFDSKLGYDPKSMVHALRSLWQAQTLKQKPELPLRVDRDTAITLRRLKSGGYSKSEIVSIVQRYDAEVQADSLEWNMPKNPDHKWMESFLMRTYKAQINANL